MGARKLHISLALTLGLLAMVGTLTLMGMLVDGPLVVRAQGTTRYVATVGTDSGDCSNSSSPCRTMSLAAAEEVPPLLPPPGFSERPDEPGRRARREDGGLSIQGIGGPGIGALRVDTGVYRVVYFAFGFEAINGQGGDSRIEVMDRVLHWLLPNHPPEEPYAPFPASGTTLAASSDSGGLAPEDIILWWSAWDRDPGDFLTYDVYFGTDPNLGADDLLVSNLLNCWFDPWPLEGNRTYYLEFSIDINSLRT